jgi:Tol biopolymer transport system component
VRASILPPSGHRFWPSSLDHLSISPDARWVTFRVQSGDQRLWVRRIDSGEARPLPGTENAIFPMWSPDSASIAFFSGRKLRKVTLDGAPPRTICEVGNRPRRGDWSSSGEIIFSPDSTTALFRVSASGGTPVALTALVTARQETTHRWATFLPDDRHFLYYAGSHDLTVDSDMQGVFVASIGEPSRRKRLLRARSNAAYVDGHLIYAHAGALLAQRFDVKKLEMIGEPFSIANAIENDAQTFLSAFAVADDATIVFRSAPGNAARQLMWLGRMGVADGTAVGEQAAFRTVRLSPDGRSAVTVIDDPETGLGDLWIYDLISTERRQIPGKSGHETDPVWSPDGKRIAFTRSRGFRADARLFIVNADGSNERPLSEPPENAAPASWSVDGHTLFGTSWQPKRGVSRVTRWDVRDGRGTHLLDGYEPRVSPDGKWLLYTAGTHPDTSVWVAHTSDGSHRQKISREPAHALVWSGDRLLYATNTQIRVVTVTTTPERVNVVDEISAYHWDQGILYVDSLDGQRFFCVVQKEEEADRGISLVSDFAAALK